MIREKINSDTSDIKNKSKGWKIYNNHKLYIFSLFCFLSRKDSTHETRENVILLQKLFPLLRYSDFRILEPSFIILH